MPQIGAKAKTTKHAAIWQNCTWREGAVPNTPRRRGRSTARRGHREAGARGATRAGGAGPQGRGRALRVLRAATAGRRPNTTSGLRAKRAPLAALALRPPRPLLRGRRRLFVGGRSVDFWYMSDFDCLNGFVFLVGFELFWSNENFKFCIFWWKCKYFVIINKISKRFSWFSLACELLSKVAHVTIESTEVIFNQCLEVVLSEVVATCLCNFLSELL